MTENELMTVIEQPELVTYDGGNQWQRAAVTWLQGKRGNTRRAYGRILVDFQQFVGGISPDQVTPDMVTAWKLHLQSLGRKDTTVAQRLAGLSSYFTHLVKHGLLDRNPCEIVDRGDLDLSPYGNARPMTMAEFRAIMGALDPTTAAGALYRALFLTYVLTGRRRSELLNLKGRDLQIDGDKVQYWYTQKGGKRQRMTLPSAAWAEIQNYLTLAGRELVDDEFVFQATHVTGNYVDDQGNYIERREGSRVSGTAVQEALKRAAERANINPDRVTLHGMRHLSAQVHFATHGGDVLGLRNHLGHSSLAVTDVYLQALASDEKTRYDAMAEMLGV